MVNGLRSCHLALIFQMVVDLFCAWCSFFFLAPICCSIYVNESLHCITHMSSVLFERVTCVVTINKSSFVSTEEGRRQGERKESVTTQWTIQYIKIFLVTAERGKLARYSYIVYGTEKFIQFRYTMFNSVEVRRVLCE